MDNSSHEYVKFTASTGIRHSSLKGNRRNQQRHKGAIVYGWCMVFIAWWPEIYQLVTRHAWIRSRQSDLTKPGCGDYCIHIPGVETLPKPLHVFWARLRTATKIFNRTGATYYMKVLFVDEFSHDHVPCTKNADATVLKLRRLSPVYDFNQQFPKFDGSENVRSALYVIPIQEPFPFCAL